MRKIIITSLLAICSLLAVSCFKYDPVVYGCTDICTVKDGMLISDFGSKYHVTESESNIWKETERVYIKFDMLESVAQNEYNIRLNEFTEFFVRSLDIAATPEEADAYGTDPAYISDGFISGSSKETLVLNTSCIFVRKKGSKTDHTLSLVFDRKNSSDDVLSFRLAHQANGDVFTEDSKVADYEAVRVNFTYPLQSILPSGSGTANLEFISKWYRQTSNGVSHETETAKNQIVLTY